MEVLVIGAGNMGFAFASAFVKAEIVHQQNVMLYDTDVNKVEQLAEEGWPNVFSEMQNIFHMAQFIVLAVKPQIANDVLDALKPYTNSDQVILSIMAGYPIKAIQSRVNTDKIVRVMPNLPLIVGKGILGYTYADSHFTPDDTEITEALLSATGDIVYLDKEQQIDAITAVSGSGPAYVMYFLNAMKNAAQQLGFNESDSLQLTLTTFKGAIELFEKGDVSFEEWINRVSSKGGTTEAAIKTMDRLQVNENIETAIKAAFNRAQELGK